MRVWTVHTPPEVSRLPRAASLESRLRLPVLVREGFAWAAFLFGPLWLLRHRLWLATVIHLATLAILVALVPGLALLPAVLALQVLLGAEAQDLRRHALARRGFAHSHVVAERDADRALARVLELAPVLDLSRALDARPEPGGSLAPAGMQPA
ncbi:MAG: hypothetical protein JWP04_1934 [Belnapia sp.]|jgi:hypothetical protein|nr:hypothetical protein [Belnapia sp.]